MPFRRFDPSLPVILIMITPFFCGLLVGEVVVFFVRQEGSGTGLGYLSMGGPVHSQQVNYYYLFFFFYEDVITLTAPANQTCYTGKRLLHEDVITLTAPANQTCNTGKRLLHEDVITLTAPANQTCNTGKRLLQLPFIQAIYSALWVPQYKASQYKTCAKLYFANCKCPDVFKFIHSQCRSLKYSSS